MIQQQLTREIISYHQQGTTRQFECPTRKKFIVRTNMNTVIQGQVHFHLELLNLYIP